MKSLLSDIFKALEKGSKTPKHPFKYVCLSSVFNNTPQQRMVVFRSIKGNEINIYTDSRTKKVNDFLTNPKASLLFYDYQKMMQIQLTGKVEVDKTPSNKLWNTLSEKAQKDYTTLFAPGSYINDPSIIDYNKDAIHFCILKFTFTKIDYLHIQKPHHTRAQFNLVNTDWEGNYLVP